MEATSKKHKTEAWINGQWQVYHLRSHTFNNGEPELGANHYICIGYGDKIKVDGIIFNSKSRLKFFKGTR